jgi:hypothetical protein
MQAISRTGCAWLAGPMNRSSICLILYSLHSFSLFAGNASIFLSDFLLPSVGPAATAGCCQRRLFALSHPDAIEAATDRGFTQCCMHTPTSEPRGRRWASSQARPAGRAGTPGHPSANGAAVFVAEDAPLQHLALLVVAASAACGAPYCS